MNVPRLEFFKSRSAVWPKLPFCAVSLFFAVALSQPSLADPLPASCSNALDNRAIAMIVPNRAGGGFDTYGRAVAKVLGETIGGHIPVSNVPGGGGVLAMRLVAGQAEDEILLYIDGVEELVNTTDFTDLIPYGSDAFDILGVVYTEPEAWLAPIGMDLTQPDLTELLFATQSLESNFVPLVMAADALGFSIDVVDGYGGSGEAFAAVLRGETDLTTASLTSTLRGAKSGDLELVMVVSDSVVPEAPNVPPFFGPNSIFEARATSWTEAERREREALAETVLALGMTRRAIFTASSVNNDILDCLRTALDRVLVSDAFVSGLELQGRPVDPVLSADAQDLFDQVRNAFEERSSDVARMLEEFETD